MAFVGTRRALLSGGFDPSAIAIFNAMTTAPTQARKRLINQTVVSLKSVGVWALLDVLYVLAAADAQAARLNWKNPGTFDAVAVNSPSFAVDRGYTGNGSSSRLRTQYTPSTNATSLTLNNASTWVWSLTNAQAAALDAGSNTGPRTGVVTRNLSDNIQGFINDSQAAGTGVSNSNSAGLLCIQRTGAANRIFFRNGASLGAQAAVSSALASQEQWICGANSTAFSAKQIALAAWGASLSGLEPAFYNATLSYMQGVGAA